MLMKNCFLIAFLPLFLFAQQISSLPYPNGAGSAEVYNNNIYLFGGSVDWGGGDTLYDSVFVFNGISWSFVDTIPDIFMWDLETVMVGNEVYLIAGWSGGQTSLRKYNLDTQQWQYLANSPNSYDWGVAAEYVNDKIYLFNPGGEVFEYNIVNNEWTTKTNAGVSGPRNLSSIVFRDEVYVIGYNDSVFVKYDPVHDQWTSLAKSTYQVGASALGIINDNIYSIGGNVSASSRAEYKSIIVYDISLNQ